MYKLSDIISMPVVSIYDSKIVGIVTNLTLDPKTNKCKQLVITTADDIKYILEYNNIKNIGDSSIVISNTTKLSLLESELCIKSHYHNPINAEIYDLQGNYLSKVSDIILDEKLKIMHIIDNKSENIDIKNIVSFTDSLVLYSEKKVKINTLKPKTASIDTYTKKPTNPISIQHIDTKPIAINTEMTKITDTRTIVGRVTTKDILSPNHEIVIRSGTTISTTTISIANRYGKIVELFRYSK